MVPRCTVGSGITGAVRYVLGEGRDPQTARLRGLKPDGPSRVAWIGGVGFGFEISSSEDADLARRIMEFAAQNQTSRTRRCEKDCLHLSLGWRPGETPTKAEMEQAALAALAALGMGNAQALFVAHSDEAYPHLHIVASRIDPETGRAFDLKGNYLKLSRWAEAYERTHGGVVCNRREDLNELRDAIEDRDAETVLELITKHRATFTTGELDRTLKKQITFDLERVQFARTILAQPEAVALSDVRGGPITRYSTKTILESEGHVLRAANGLARNRRHSIPETVRANILAEERYAGMSRQQANAVRHATGSEGLALIDGQAGTGKSFTMGAVRAAYEAQRYEVIGLAPTNAVAQDMKRDGFRAAATIHSQLFALNNHRARWTRRTVVMIDEAAMIDTKLMAMVTAHAYQAGAKLILIGDDRQLSSIDYGGTFSILRDRYGAAELTEVRRQSMVDDRRATEMLAEGNFGKALASYQAKGAIKWCQTTEAARAALVASWADDSLAAPEKSRFVFAYTNVEVDRLNRDIRSVRMARGELGISHVFETKHGAFEFSDGDRFQFTGTDKVRGIFNGNAGTIEKIEDTEITVRLDGEGRRVVFDGEQFIEFRHGYAGTIYKGQGRTINEAYLYHTQHWRRASSYVALSRHREKVELFVARDVAADLRTLSWQMARREERRAASHFFNGDAQPGPVRPLTPAQLSARIAERSLERNHRRAQLRHEFVEAADENATRASGGRHDGKDKAKGKRRGKSISKGRGQSSAYPAGSAKAGDLTDHWSSEHSARSDQREEREGDGTDARGLAGRKFLSVLWRRAAELVTRSLASFAARPTGRPPGDEPHP